MTRPRIPRSGRCGLLLLGFLGGCGPADQIEVLVQVPGLTPDVASLTVMATLNGMPAAQPLQVTQNLDAFVIDLPTTTTGDLALTATGYDGQSCRLGSGQTSLAVPAGPPYQLATVLPLELLSTAVCGVTLQRTGPGTIVSEPPALTCAPPSTECSAELPKGATLTLRSSDVLTTYLNWSGACTGAGTCTLVAQGSSGPPQPLAVDTFPRQCYASNNHFCSYNGLPAATDVYNLSGTGPSDLWAAAGSEGLWHYDGSYWRASFPGDGMAVWNAIWAGSPTDVWALSSTSAVAHFDGAAWTLAPGFAGISWSTIWGSDSNNIWLGGDYGRLYHYNGSSFTLESTDLSSTDAVASIRGTSLQNVWAVSTGGKILQRAIDGSWHTQHTVDPQANGLQDIWTSGPSDVFVLGITASLHYDGTTWATVAGVIGRSIWGSGPSDVWTSGGDLIWHYNGSWSQVPIQNDGTGGINLWSVFGTSSSDVWFGGKGGVLLHANAPTQAAAPGGAEISAIHSLWGSSASDIWATGGDGALLHFDGQSWSRRPSPTQRPLNSVFGSQGSDVWAVGDHVVLHYDGTSWSAMSGTSTSGTWNGVWASLAHNVWIVGTGGRVLSGTSGQVSQVSATTSCSSSDLYAVWGSSDSDIWVAGDGGALCNLMAPAKDPAPALGSGISLRTLTGNNGSDVWAGGLDRTSMNWTPSVLHFDGGTWTADTQAQSLAYFQVLAMFPTGSGGIWAVSGGVSSNRVMRRDSGTWTDMGVQIPAVLLAGWANSPGDAWFAGAAGTLVRYQP